TVQPSNLDTSVDPTQTVRVTFDQPLDPSQDLSGLIGLGSATVTQVNRPADNVIEVEHTNWNQGEQVTATLDASIKSASGGTLGTTYSWNFWTQTPSVLFLSSIPADQATGVNTNVQMTLLFSAYMDVSSLSSEISAQEVLPDPPGGFNDLAFQVSSGQDNWITLSFDSELPANATIRVTIPVTAQANDGRNLSTEAVIEFETGATGDTTPPNLVSLEPANGSMISPATSYIRFTFDEPIDPNDFDPSTLGAQLLFLVDSSGEQPQWSQNFTVFTVPLPHPLPSGLPLRATFDHFSDMAGNVNTSGLDLSLTVSGAVDYYPFLDGMKFGFQSIRYYDQGSGQMGPQFYGSYESLRREDATTWNRVSYDDAFQTENGWDILSRTSSAIQLMGFTEYDGGTLVETTLNPPVDWLKLPLSTQTWSGTTTASNSGSTIQIEYSAELLGQEDLPLTPDIPFSARKIWPSSSKQVVQQQVVWYDCWKWTLDFAMKDGDVTVQSGADTLWYAPGIGKVWERDREEDGSGNWQWTQNYLMGLSLPGYEFPSPLAKAAGN
ncbi:MAG TPA: Ig-like domain-containing protein, partial [Candidatus Krumholzibacteria bacterium]|nr:Ig-like domain-containing protein [Candidatus Krumholzibacteria bacterium]